MANKKYGGAVQATSSPQPMHDYQCEEDVRTLTRAAEVMADHGRRRSALAKFKMQVKGSDRLINVLSNRKKG